MKKILLAVIFCLAIFAIAKAQTVSGSIGNGTIRRGGTAKGTVVLSIPDGVHTNSSRPKGEYLLPTRVKVSGAGIQIGAVNYPRGTDKKFEFSDEPLNVYERRAAFNFNVAVPANYKGNTIKIRAVVNFQACTHEVCFPPKKEEVILTARVK